MKIADKTNVQRKKKNWQKDWQLHLMILPGLLFILIFKYMPLGGITISRNFCQEKEFGDLRGLD